REWTVKDLFEKRDIWQQMECTYIPVIDVSGFISGCLSRREGYIEKVSPENFIDVVLKPFSRPRMRRLYYDRDPEKQSRKAAKGRQFGFAIALRPGRDFAGQKQFHFEEAESLMFFDKELMLKIDLLFLLDDILRKQEGFIIESLPEELLAPLLSRELSTAFLAYYSAYETAPPCLIDRGVMDHLKVNQREGVYALSDVLKDELIRMAEEGRIRSSMNSDALRRYLQELQPPELAFRPGQLPRRISRLPTLENTFFSKRMFRRSLFSGDRFRRKEALRAMALMSEEKTIGLAGVEDIVLEALPLNLFSRQEQRSIIRMLEERLFLFQPKTESLVIVTQFNFFSEVEEAPDWTPLVKYLSRDEVIIFIRILSTLSFYSEYEDARALAFNYWTKLAVLCVDRAEKSGSSLDYEPLRNIFKDALERKEYLFSLRGASLSAKIDSLLLWENAGLTDDEYSLREIKKFLLDEEVNREAVNILTFTDMGLMLWRSFLGSIRPEEFSFELLEEIETMIINDDIGIFSRSGEIAVFGEMSEIMEESILSSGLCRMETVPMSIRFLKEIPTRIFGQEGIINALAWSPNTALWLLPHCEFPEAGILLEMIEKYGETEPGSVHRRYTERIRKVKLMKKEERRVREDPASDGGVVGEYARRIDAVIPWNNPEEVSADYSSRFVRENRLGSAAEFGELNDYIAAGSALRNETGILAVALFGLYLESKTGPPGSRASALPVGTAVSLLSSLRISNPYIIDHLQKRLIADFGMAMHPDEKDGGRSDTLGEIEDILHIETRSINERIDQEVRSAVSGPEGMFIISSDILDELREMFREIFALLNESGVQEERAGSTFDMPRFLSFLQKKLLKSHRFLMFRQSTVMHEGKLIMNMPFLSLHRIIQTLPVTDSNVRGENVRGEVLFSDKTIIPDYLTARGGPGIQPVAAAFGRGGTGDAIRILADIHGAVFRLGHCYELRRRIDSDGQLPFGEQTGSDAADDALQQLLCRQRPEADMRRDEFIVLNSWPYVQTKIMSELCRGTAGNETAEIIPYALEIGRTSYHWPKIFSLLRYEFLSAPKLYLDLVTGGYFLRKFFPNIIQDLNAASIEGVSEETYHFARKGFQDEVITTLPHLPEGVIKEHALMLAEGLASAVEDESDYRDGGWKDRLRGRAYAERMSIRARWAWIHAAGFFIPAFIAGA
ncbi:MAG: hypothetical protein WC329_08470, partial [Candidatus Omnitrophota bacterium]